MKIAILFYVAAIILILFSALLSFSKLASSYVVMAITILSVSFAIIGIIIDYFDKPF